MEQHLPRLPNMPLPVLDKTWQHTVNVACNSSSTLLLAAKNALIGFASNPWTVWGSCDGTNIPPEVPHYGNGDGIDRWTSPFEVKWSSSGGNHSWMVLKQPGLGTNAAICLDCNYGSAMDASYMGIIFFPTGVGTNGSLTARPSAIDEILLLDYSGGSGPYEFYGSALSTMGAWTGRVHVMQSTDGECTRVVVTRSGTLGFTGATGCWIFDKMKSPAPALTQPVAVAMCGSNGSLEGGGVYGALNDDIYCWGPNSSSIAEYYFTTEGAGTTSLGQQITVADDDTGEWPMFSIDVASQTLYNRGVKRGRIYDLWWGATAVATGDCYPGDGSRQFVQFGDLIHPWDGSIPLIT